MSTHATETCPSSYIYHQNNQFIDLTPSPTIPSTHLISYEIFRAKEQAFVHSQRRSPTTVPKTLLFYYLSLPLIITFPDIISLLFYKHTNFIFPYILHYIAQQRRVSAPHHDTTLLVDSRNTSGEHFVLYSEQSRPSFVRSTIFN